MKKIFQALALYVVLMLGVSFAFEFGSGGGSGGGVAGWPAISAIKLVTWANSFANALRVEDGSDTGWAFYTHATDGPVAVPYCDGVENDCDRYQKVGAGHKAGFKDSDGNTDVEYDEATGNLTTNQQLIVSNKGVEFTESDTNPTCGAGNYNVYADTSETKLKACQNGVASDLLGAGGGGDTFVRKTSDETVNNSNSRQDDDVLLFAVDANSTYSFSGLIVYSSAEAADWQQDFTVPAGATGYKSALSATGTACNGSSPLMNQTAIASASNSIAGDGVGVPCFWRVEGVVITGGTAGNVVLRWAQSTADLSNTVVHAGSYLRYRKIS